jgi:hypothetical protein
MAGIMGSDPATGNEYSAVDEESLLDAIADAIFDDDDLLLWSMVQARTVMPDEAYARLKHRFPTSHLSGSDDDPHEIAFGFSLNSCISSSSLLKS